MTTDDRLKRSRGRSPKSGRNTLIRPAIAVALAVLAAAVVARPFAERFVITKYLERSTGASVTIGSIADGLGSVRINNLQLDAGGGVAFDAPQTTVAFSGTPVVELDAPHLAYAADAPESDQSAKIAATIGWLRGLRAVVDVRNGSVDVRSASSVEPLLALRDVNANVKIDPSAALYRLKFNVHDGETDYPVDASGNGKTYAWTAATLPAAVLNAFATPAAFDVRSGLLRDVSIAGDGSLHAGAAIENVSASVGTGTIDKLNGTLTVAGDRIGTSGLSGTFAGVPFSIVGEAHDFAEPWRALHEGTRDLRSAARLLSAIGARPNLTFARMEFTAPGIVFGQYGVTSPVGPHVVQLIAIDPGETTVHFDTALSSDHVISKGERTSDLAVRTNAVAGVNGDYFDIGRTYEPQGMLIKSGTLVRSPTDRASLTIDRTNHVTFAEFHLNGSVELDGRSYPLTQYNSWPLSDATVITPDYGETLRAADGITFARLEPVDQAQQLYRVTSVEKADHALPVSLGVAFGPDAKGAAPRVGDTVKIRYSFTPAIGPDVIAAIGGGPILLRNGAWYEDPHAPAPDERDVRWPVVAIGAMADGTLLLASVDGRHPERSVGMTRPEFADLLKSFGVTDAMALDSGGSVTMVARTPGDTKASVHNAPSDNSAERYISDALLVYSSAPPNTIVTSTPLPSPSPLSSPHP